MREYAEIRTAQYSPERADVPRGWVFSKNTDIAVFWAPLLVALFLKQFEMAQYAAYFFMMRIGIDMSHVTATVHPVQDRLRRGRMNRILFYISVLAVPIFAVAVYGYSKLLFISLFGANAITHICRQQYGMVMVSRRNAGENIKSRWLDALMICNVTAFPTLWWLSDRSPIRKAYFNEHDLEFVGAVLPPWLMYGLLAVHWAYNAFYAYKVWRSWSLGAKPNWPKIGLLASTWLWFYGGILIFKSGEFFFYAGAMIHGLPYLLFTARRQDIENPMANRFSHRRLVVAQGLAAVWCLSAYFMSMPLPLGQKHWLEPILCLPLIVHYCLDIFIWRKSAFAPPRNLKSLA